MVAVCCSYFSDTVRLQVWYPGHMELIHLDRAMIEYDDNQVEEVDLNNETILAERGLVWAQTKTFPWWPSQKWRHVGKPPSGGPDAMVVIEFLGEDHTAPISAVETCAFLPNFDKHIGWLIHPEGDARKRRARKNAPHAVQVALEALEGMGRVSSESVAKINGDTFDAIRAPTSLVAESVIADEASEGLIKKAGSKFPPDVTEALVKSYKLCSRPTTEQVRELQNSCGLQKSEIELWFLNRRTLRTRLRKASNESPSIGNRLNTVILHLLRFLQA